MQTISSYLKQYKEDVPQWLSNYKENSNLSFSDIMQGRVGFYPGSRLDGNLVAVSNKAHCVHSFLYVDYYLKKAEILKELEIPNSSGRSIRRIDYKYRHYLRSAGFSGYHSIGRIDWETEDILPHGPYMFSQEYYNYRFKSSPYDYIDKNETPYCFTEILERNSGLNDENGSKRFACTFLFADGIAAYFNLFVKQYKKAPWILLLQDHIFGGNYDSFGKGGALDAIIKKDHIRPKFVISGTDNMWDGYIKVEGLLQTSTSEDSYPFQRHLFVDVEN